MSLSELKIYLGSGIRGDIYKGAMREYLERVKEWNKIWKVLKSWCIETSIMTKWWCGRDEKRSVL